MHHNHQSSNYKTQGQTRKLRITNISLSIKDCILENMIREIAIPIYIKFYDRDEDRMAIFEFKHDTSMNEIVEKLNNKELDGQKLIVEVLESKKYRNRSPRFMNPIGKPRTPRRKQRFSQPTLKQLDNELEDYMRG